MRNSRFSILQRILIKYRQFRYQGKNSSPFLSGDAFAEICDYSISRLSDLENLKGKRLSGSSVFCRSELLPTLIDSLQADARPRVLICGNSDFDFTEIPQGLYDHFDSIVLQNSFISDGEKIFTLPIGIENLSYGINGLPKNLRSMSNWNAREPRILVGPFSPTHPERVHLLEAANDSSVCKVLSHNQLTSAQYSEYVNNYRFVAAPRGNGVDTHRFWEALYRGAVPIVKRSPWSKSLSIYGIPYAEVDDWTANELSRVANEWKLDGFDPKSIPSLWIGYWKSKLRLNE